MYLYELFRQLTKLGEIDVDLNMLGIMSFYDYQNLRFLLQVFKREGQDISLLVLVDGDSEGKGIVQRVSALCKRLAVPTLRLADGKSIEDYCIFEEEFIQAVKKTLQNACEAEGKPVPRDLDDRVRAAWSEQKAAKEKTERRDKGDKTEKPEREEKGEKREKKTTGRWFKDLSSEIIEDEASKIVLARVYAELCREAKTPAQNRERVRESTVLCRDIATKLSLPAVRAMRVIEVAPQKTSGSS